MKNDVEHNPAAPPDDPRDEYDFGDAKKNPYADRYAKGTNVVLLSPDVATAFPDSESVNRALRACLQLADVLAKQSSKRAG